MPFWAETRTSEAFGYSAERAVREASVF